MNSVGAPCQLAGDVKRVTLTREAPRNNALLLRLENLCDVAEVPLTLTRMVDAEAFEAALSAIDITPQTVVVTSARAARAAAQLYQTFSDVSVVAVGGTTKQALEGLGLTKIAIAPEESATSVASMPLVGPVVSVGAKVPRPELADSLTAAGITHRHLVAYETIERQLSSDESERLASSDVVVIAAPSAWRVAAPHVRAATLVVAIGSTTAGEVRKSHNKVVIASRVDDIVAAAI